MANPQTEDGYIRIANEIFDALIKIRIPGEARQVLDVIIRKTWGWRKKSAVISLSEFCLATGLNKQGVVRAINKLKAMNIIEINAGSIKKSYVFNKDHNTWQALSKKIMAYKRKSSLLKFCYICNFKEALHKHHIIPIKQGGQEKVHNKITLCPNCHALVHKGKYSEQYLVILKDNTEGVIKKDKAFKPYGKQALSKKITPTPGEQPPARPTGDPKDIQDKDKERKNTLVGIQKFWNSNSIVSCRNLKSCEGFLNARLKTYSENEIKEAIKNYATILHSPEYQFSYRWTLKDFIQRKNDNIARFLNSAKPFQSLPKTKLDNAKQTKSATKQWLESQTNLKHKKE